MTRPAIDRTVSVITPMLNSIELVDRCVAEVLAQGTVILEHIIADGGSSDGTVARLEEHATRHPHIRIIHGPDKGQSDALNKASEAAQGMFISILNADDYYQPKALARMATLLAETDRPTFLTGNCEIVHADGSHMLWNIPSDLRRNSLLLGYELVQHPTNPSAYLYHRSVHGLVGGYDVNEHYAMDLDFILRCAANVEMRYVNEHWGNFVLAPGTKTFDDPQGPERARQLRMRHLRELGWRDWLDVHVKYAWLKTNQKARKLPRRIAQLRR